MAARGRPERVKSMFYHAYDNYLENAFPYDELRPLTCDGQDTWGSFSLTLIDALDTLLVMVGGLLSAHLLSKKAGIEVEAGWPCSGPLLRMAEDAARKLLPGNSWTVVGNHVDVVTAKWVAQDAGIGAGVDSYFEYLVKGAILLQDEELMSMFLDYNRAIKNYTKFDDWYLWVQMYKGTVSMPVFQSLEAYWPGLQIVIHSKLKNVYFSSVLDFAELIESAMYLYRATRDPTLLELGRDVVEAIEKICKVECGFATIKDLRDHRLDNRMESFFLAETVKYLYLLFDPDNFIHNNGSSFDVMLTPYGECILGAGGYIFNTEAHPIDPAALHCCRKQKEEQWEVEDLMREFYSLKRSKKFTFTRTSDQKEESRQKGSADTSSKNCKGQIKQKEKRRTLLSCPSQPFNSKLAVLGQVFFDNT
ncbi:hypothetical protein JD844_018648 [Phrynosoma platyrhinos]|uniref:alpha-1,2-Mannosidase n=1 Tax=Phrynosoma platyrhinos TaxID=52577 RepID=A0ABQ7SP22_PHRPL|nr:hypothetical protein JD844_018648 [Phrynosoma platyrhinos]